MKTDFPHYDPQCGLNAQKFQPITISPLTTRYDIEGFCKRFSLQLTSERLIESAGRAGLLLDPPREGLDISLSHSGRTPYETCVIEQLTRLVVLNLKKSLAWPYSTFLASTTPPFSDEKLIDFCFDILSVEITCSSLYSALEKHQIAETGKDMFENKDITDLKETLYNLADCGLIRFNSKNNLISFTTPRIILNYDPRFSY